MRPYSSQWFPMKAFLTRSKLHTPIPYDAKGPTVKGHIGCGYVDTKRNPDLIDKIPELKTSPHLRKFVRLLNEPDSLFRTLGCDHYDKPSDSPNFKELHVTYVTVVYEILDWNLTEDSFVGLFDRFSHFAGSKQQLPKNCGTEFRIGLTTFSSHGVNGYHVDLITSGYAQTQPEARRCWLDAHRIVEEFFAEQNRRHRKSNWGDLKTIS